MCYWNWNTNIHNRNNIHNSAMLLSDYIMNYVGIFTLYFIYIIYIVHICINPAIMLLLSNNIWLEDTLLFISKHC